MGKIVKRIYRGTVQTTPPGGTIWYIGHGADNNNTTTVSEVINFGPPPLDCTLVEAQAQLNVAGTLGSSEPIRISINKNSGTESVILSGLTATQTSNNDNNDGLSVDFLTTDHYSVKVVFPAWVTKPTLIAITIDLVFEYAEDRNFVMETFYPMSGSNAFTPIANSTYYTGSKIANITDVIEKQPWSFPFTGNVVGAVLVKQNATTGSSEQITTNLRKNSVSSELIDNTWTWDGGLTTNKSVVVPLDSISIPVTPSDKWSLETITPNWSTPPGVVTCSVSLLIEKT